MWLEYMATACNKLVLLTVDIRNVHAPQSGSQALHVRCLHCCSAKFTQRPAALGSFIT